MESTGFFFTLILMIPLLGAIVAYFSKAGRASIISTISILAGFVLSLGLIFSTDTWMSKFTWLPDFEMGWRLDRVSMLLFCLVLFISLLVHIFSIKYMKAEEQPRYFGKLVFFTFSMLGLLASDHLILLFIFWELVGFSSYLLIGFWHEKDESATSAKWAFLTNRVADVALLAAILGLGVSDTFFISELSGTTSIWIGCGLLIGAMGKSGQFPFMAWLPRAMTGPTPVSALIHAATMVAAGVYLLIRMAPFLPETVLNLTVVVGCTTAAIGAFSALTQHDIKKVLAYSTVSQLGFMFLSIGAGSIESSFFHLWTHAFFKAGLFLSSGVIIHKMGTQDMRQMGGLKSKIPLVFTVFLICGLALTGIPLFSGFMSKEGILLAVWDWSNTMAIAGYEEAQLVTIFTFFSVFLTAWYFGRQILLVFFGDQRSHREFRLNTGLSMTFPLIALAIGSVWISHGWNPFSFTGYVMNLISTEELNSANIAVMPVILALTGLILSYFIYRPSAGHHKEYARKSIPDPLAGKLSYSALYLDLIYEKIIGSGYLILTKSLSWIDRKVIDRVVDGLGVFVVVFSKFLALIDRVLVDGLIRLFGAVSILIGNMTRRTQSRYLQKQLTWALVGVILILFYLQFIKND